MKHSSKLSSAIAGVAIVYLFLFQYFTTPGYGTREIKPRYVDIHINDDILVAGRSNFSKRAFESDHKLYKIFELHNFPEAPEDYDTFVGPLSHALSEALLVIYAGWKAVKDLDSNNLSPSFRRYFRDEDFPMVKAVFEEITQTLNIMYGYGLPGFDMRSCSRLPDLLPIKIFYKNSRADRLTFCKDHPGVSAYSSWLPYDGAHPSTTKVPRYLVVCPLLLAQELQRDKPQPLDIVPMRQLRDGRDPGSYASAIGEGYNAPKGGMWSTGVILAHELIHGDDIYKHITGDTIKDQLYTPPGFKNPTIAYTSWKCQQLRRSKPELAAWNDNNYIYFALEHWWYEEIKRTQGREIQWLDAPRSVYDYEIQQEQQPQPAPADPPAAVKYARRAISADSQPLKDMEMLQLTDVH